MPISDSTVLLVVAVVMYGVAGAAFLAGVVGGWKVADRIAPFAAAAGFVAHTAAIVLEGIRLHMVPFMNLSGSLVFFAWAVMAFYITVARSHRINGIGAFASFMSGGTVTTALLLPNKVSGMLIPALNSHWSTIHIGSALISYAGFFLAFASALGYLIQERMLKSKRISAMQKRLPPLDMLDSLAYRMIAVSFPMLTLGIITGALWAQQAWGSYWTWDPKESWALVTWLLYAAYLHVRVIQGWRGKWANRLLIAGFACMLITFVGVNLLSTGLHKYNW
jgi:cytochrome c-type biogenesis protein CcsB